MDKVDIITDNNNSRLSNLAVDGLIYGLIGGFAMYIILAATALLTGDSPATVLARFNTDGLTSPLRGMISHLAVSAIYGTLFGVLVWPLLSRFANWKAVGWIGGLAYAGLLFALSQVAVLPLTNSPLGQIPVWQWGLGHAVYGLVLGVMFARKAG